jgi:hypothetical protein
MEKNAQVKFTIQNEQLKDDRDLKSNAPAKNIAIIPLEVVILLIFFFVNL